MKLIKLKIGVQSQANKPVFLMPNGSVVCGNFQYKGRFAKKFKEYYTRIRELSGKKLKKGVLDVSGSAYWDAETIYDNYILLNWKKSVSAKKLKQFADESEIRGIIESIIPEFKRALSSKWLRIFKSSELDDRPKEAWQIL